MVAEPDPAEKPRLACWVRCWLRSEVVSHFWTVSLAADAGAAGITTSASPRAPARAPTRPARRVVLDIRVKPLGECPRLASADDPAARAAMCEWKTWDV